VGEEHVWPPIFPPPLKRIIKDIYGRCPGPCTHD